MIIHKKKILLIIPWLPYPITSGGHLAIYNGIKAIFNDYSVYITYEAWNNKEFEDAKTAFQRECPNVIHIPLLHKLPQIKTSKSQVFFKRVKASLMALIDKAVSPRELDPLDCLINKWQSSINPINPLWQSHLSWVFSHYSFDIVQVEMPWFLPIVFNLPNTVRKVYVHHELGIIRRELELKQFSNQEYLKTVKAFIDLNEVSQLNRYDCVITLSNTDAGKLRSAGVTTPVYPSFISIDILESGYEVCDGKTLVFLGPDYHTPNLMGLSWFLDNCWGKLLQKDKSYKLKIIGKWNNDNITAFKRKYSNLTFTGFVKNLEDEIKGTIMIVPILIGSGIRIKILEACSKGIPFVSTSIGAEGIPLEDGHHCIIADDIDAFVQGVTMLQNEELQKKFVYNSKKMIRDYFSLEALRKNRINIYESLS